MSRQINHIASEEFPCPVWVHDATILGRDLSYYMLDTIQSLRTIDSRYKLPKAWLGHDLSVRERAQVIMQHMEWKPWLCDSEEDFAARLQTCIISDFVRAHIAEVQRVYRLFLWQVPRVDDGYANAEGLEGCLKFRAFMEAALTLLLSHKNIKGEKYADAKNNNKNNKTKNLSLRDPRICWGSISDPSSPLDSLVDSTRMQQRHEQQQHPQEEEEANQACCYWEQPQPQQLLLGDQPTGKSWLERHGITTTTYEPRDKKRHPIGISRTKRLVNRVRRTLSASSGQGKSRYRARRGGKVPRDVDNGTLALTVAELHHYRMNPEDDFH